MVNHAYVANAKNQRQCCDMHADFDLASDGSTIPFRGSHGGAREGAGKKPGSYVKPEEAVNFDKARARNEDAKAGLNELKLKIESNEYLSRGAFREASATLLAELAQGLRSLPDILERKFNLPPAQVELVAEAIDEALTSVADGLELFTGAEE